MFNQAVEVVARMQNDEAIDFEEDWKMLTLFIGGNDLCAVCRNVSLDNSFFICITCVPYYMQLTVHYYYYWCDCG